MSVYATPPIQRRLMIVSAVLGLHLAGLWALQTGLLQRAADKVMPVLVMAQLIEAPQPETPPPAPAPPTEKARPSSPAPQQANPAATRAPQPLATASPTPATDAPTGTTEPDPAPHALMTAANEPAAAPPAPPAPPRVELPSSSANYLNNPRPQYPTLSTRLGEQGLVVVRVFIEANGTASQAEIHSSSGYDRLDQTALQTVLKWRYTPGKRNGVAEAMWFNVPIRFDLK